MIKIIGLLTEMTYRGEILLSLPSRWAYGGEFLNRLFAFGFEIPSYRKEPFYFASMINNMSNSVSYIHCYVVYEEITELIKLAKESLNNEFLINSNNEWDMSPSFKESNHEKEHDPEQFYITEPTEINKNQQNFYFPTVIAFKSDGVYHNSFRGLLEGLYNILKGTGEDYSDKIFKTQEDLHIYRMMRFTANIFLLLNDFIRPLTSTILNYNCAMHANESVLFHEKSVLHLPFTEEILLLVIKQ